LPPAPVPAYTPPAPAFNGPMLPAPAYTPPAPAYPTYVDPVVYNPPMPSPAYFDQVIIPPLPVMADPFYGG